MMNVIQKLSQLDEFGAELQERYREIYGKSQKFIQERRQAHREILHAFGEAYGMDREVLLVRSPSRVNLLGMHIEHRGGYVNPIAVGYEMLVAASAREDDVVQLKNIENDAFPDESFSIGELLPADYADDWLAFLDSSEIEQGHWGNYSTSSILRLQMEFAPKRLCGMDIMVSGNIPRGGGVSSSSAIVVATALATVELNNLEIDRKDLTVLCGEGEWYVGTRGGAGDQGAMLLGKQGFITHMQFFPLRCENIPLPENSVVLICKSFVDAHKAAGARSVFNERVATYDVTLMLIRKKYPELADRINYVRDISAAHLGKDDAWICDLLRSLPEYMTRDEIRAELPDEHEALTTLFNTHDDPAEGYKIRQVMLYGAGECARAEIAGPMLKEGRFKEFGEIMFVAHDGDRIATFNADGHCQAHDYRITDEYLDAWMEKLSNGDERSGLHWQPGGYACSHEKVDQIVDILANVPGVLGARLTGAGLGGCVVALVDEEQADNAIRELNDKYYEPNGLPEGAEKAVSVEGACLL